MGDASWHVYSNAGPTPLDLSLTEDLEKTLRANNMYESEGEATIREEVLTRPPPPDGRHEEEVSHMSRPLDSRPAPRAGALQARPPREEVGARYQRQEGVHRADAIRRAHAFSRRP